MKILIQRCEGKRGDGLSSASSTPLSEEPIEDGGKHVNLIGVDESGKIIGHEGVKNKKINNENRAEVR